MALGALDVPPDRNLFRRRDKLSHHPGLRSAEVAAQEHKSCHHSVNERHYAVDDVVEFAVVEGSGEHDEHSQDEERRMPLLCEDDVRVRDLVQRHQNVLPTLIGGTAAAALIGLVLGVENQDPGEARVGRCVEPQLPLLPGRVRD